MLTSRQSVIAAVAAAGRARYPRALLLMTQNWPPLGSLIQQGGTNTPGEGKQRMSVMPLPISG